MHGSQGYVTTNAYMWEYRKMTGNSGTLVHKCPLGGIISQNSEQLIDPITLKMCWKKFASGPMMLMMIT